MRVYETAWDEEGFALRDPGSTPYVGAIETAQEFGSLQARLEPRRKEGRHRDGAEWPWNVADQHFSGAMQIVDLYHARQYLWVLARKLFPNQQAEPQRWMILPNTRCWRGRLKIW